MVDLIKSKRLAGRAVLLAGPPGKCFVFGVCWIANESVV